MVAYSNGYWNIAEILKNNDADDTLGNNVKINKNKIFSINYSQYNVFFVFFHMIDLFLILINFY